MAVCAQILENNYSGERKAIEIWKKGWMVKLGFFFRNGSERYNIPWMFLNLPSPSGINLHFSSPSLNIPWISRYPFAVCMQQLFPGSRMPEREGARKGGGGGEATITF